jgi:hypothetical protein
MRTEAGPVAERYRGLMIEFILERSDIKHKSMPMHIWLCEIALG